MDEIIGVGTGATVRAVREDLCKFWLPYRQRGDRAPPPSRVTFSADGWRDFLADPEIRQVFMPNGDARAWASVFLGAEVVVDVDQREPFRTEIREGEKP